MIDTFCLDCGEEFSVLGQNKCPFCGSFDIDTIFNNDNGYYNDYLMSNLIIDNNKGDSDESRRKRNN